MDIHLSAHLNNSMRYQFNDSRIETILKAKTLNEASKMGLWDRISDYFRGGVKKESIRLLYEQITSSDTFDTQALRISDRFSKLRSLATEEHQTKFHINVDSSSSNYWYFNLKIGEQVIFQSEKLDKGLGNDFDEVSTLAKCIGFANACIEKKELLSLDDFVESRIECMSDDNSERKYLHQYLDDPCFSSAKFIGIEPHKEDSKFIAHFEGGSLVLSNRYSERNEYRGELLQGLLKNSEFINLRSLLSEGHGTEKDTVLLYMAQPSKGELTNILGGEGKFSDENIRAIAYNQKVVNTTVGELWQLDAPMFAGLMTDWPNTNLLLNYLDDFIKVTDNLWYEINKDKSEDTGALLDQGARRLFNRTILMREHLNTLSGADIIQMLKNMEGEFGLRLRGVFDFAGEKVAASDENADNHRFICTVNKYSPLMEDLIVTLHDLLGEESVQVDKCEFIENICELTASEIQALLKIGIKQTMLE